MLLHQTQKKAVDLLNTNARNILLYGGSRSGKTAVIIYMQLIIALNFPHSRHLIARLHLAHLKSSIIHDTFPKVASMISESLYKYIQRNFNRTDYYIIFPNGSSIWFGGLSDENRSDKILGNEYATIFLNEATDIDYSVVEKSFTRVAQKIVGFNNRLFLDCNPTTKLSWVYQLMIEKIDPLDLCKKNTPQNYASLYMHPRDNVENLASDYIDLLEDLSDQKKKRFLHGVWVNEVAGALWSRDLIYSNRAKEIPIEDYSRVVIGVDPAMSCNKHSDETGIVVVGLKDNIGYVLNDSSGKHSASYWGSLIGKLYNSYKADKIVAETNQGGDLVEINVRIKNKNIIVKKIHAKRGKFLRAEPIVTLYERGLVKHVGVFSALEEQMMCWVPSGNVITSPDRIDALVYALTELMINTSNVNIMRL